MSSSDVQPNLESKEHVSRSAARVASASRRVWACVLILIGFALVLGFKYQKAGAEDLCSSYMGAVMLGEGHADHLYSYDPVNFSYTSDPLWNVTARVRGGMHPESLHPYVQTPLWAWCLRPFAVHTMYPTFSRTFQWIFAACFAGWIALTVFAWAPRLQTPLAIFLICGLAFVFQPIRYSMALGQTHVLYMFAAFAAVLLARRDRPIAAGLLLAFAAAVKLTPALLAVYWLFTRKWRAAAVFAVASAAMVVLAIVTTGWPLFAVYLHRIQQISHVLLPAYNNQSLAAWWPLRHDSIKQLHTWTFFPLPAVVRVTGNVLTIASVALGVWMDRDLPDSLPPYGAVLVLIATSLFSPINWLHYAMMLLVPLILFVDRAILLKAQTHGRRAGVLVCAAIVVYALNVYPETWALVHKQWQYVVIVRLQFYAELIAMAGLALLAYWHRSSPSSVAAGEVANAWPEGARALVRNERQSFSFIPMEDVGTAVGSLLRSSGWRKQQR